MSSVNRQIRLLLSFGQIFRRYPGCSISTNDDFRLKFIGNVKTYSLSGESLECRRTRSFSHHRDHVGEPHDRRTVSEVLKHWIEMFHNNNIPEPDSSAKILLAHLLGSADVGILALKSNKQLSDVMERKLNIMGNLRLLRVPVQYIIGEWDFLDLSLKMMPPVFIPRPETETFALLASANAGKALQCLEIGCGTGALSLYLLKRHPQLNCTAIDANVAAVSLAQKNSQLLGLDDRLTVHHLTLTENFKSDWDHCFDIIISNPPYIPTDEIQTLEPEVQKYEDVLALDGGDDGTNVIRLILEQSPKWLKPGGRIFLEMDPRQVATVRSLWDGPVKVHPDCFGVDRLVVLEFNPK